MKPENKNPKGIFNPTTGKLLSQQAAGYLHPVEGNQRREERNEEDIIRIISTDIPGNKNVLAGLTRMKGVSWSISNAICNVLKIDKTKKVKDLSKEEIDRISRFIENPGLPEFLKNRRKDREDGGNRHLTTHELALSKEFDIKRLKKIRSYKGVRHSAGQPVRGQRTKSHFRKNKTVGVMKRAKAPGK